MNSLTLSLRDYKCFEHQDISLPRITVLTGVNSGGKTSLLQALLLLRHLVNSNDEEQPENWPLTLGGVAIGDLTSSIRNSAPRADITIAYGAESAEVLLQRESSYRANGSLQEFLDTTWRTVATSHLPLSVEQEVGERKLSDPIFDHSHALLELHHYDILRKHPNRERTGLALRTAVEQVLTRVTLGTRVQLQSSGIPGKLSLTYAPASADGEYCAPEQYGTGVTAALPLCIHLCSATSGQVLIVQDPESHLHPRGQSVVGRELAKCASNGVRIVIETHSEHILNGIKLGLLELGRDLQEDLACYYLDNESGIAAVEQISIDRNGLTRSWPSGFFDQSEVDLIELATRLSGA